MAKELARTPENTHSTGVEKKLGETIQDVHERQAVELKEKVKADGEAAGERFWKDVYGKNDPIERARSRSTSPGGPELSPPPSPGKIHSVESSPSSNPLADPMVRVYEAGPNGAREVKGSEPQIARSAPNSEPKNSDRFEWSKSTPEGWNEANLIHVDTRKLIGKLTSVEGVGLRVNQIKRTPIEAEETAVKSRPAAEGGVLKNVGKALPLLILGNLLLDQIKGVED